MNTILHAVLEATIVSKFVMALLLVMSLASWAYMAGKWATLRSARRRVVAGAARFEEAGVLDAALSVLEGDSISPLFRITGRAVKEFNRINATGDADRLIDSNVRRALHQGIDEEMSRLKSSLALLATAANTAPFIGLFGTVWGIMHSFQSIASMKSVSWPQSRRASRKRSSRPRSACSWRSPPPAATIYSRPVCPSSKVIASTSRVCC